ncbi:MAG: TolC family protein [Pirellulaceae bacterium]
MSGVPLPYPPTDRSAIILRLSAATAFACIVFVLGNLVGCTRSKYTLRADKEAYCLVESRQLDPLWELPTRTVEPQPESRMRVTSALECAPKPIDDRAAHQFMDCPDGFNNTKYYSKIPTQGHTENPIWIDYLPRDAESQISLTQPLAIDLALLHSRDYQTQFEQVYVTALALSGNRFEFDTQWAGGVGTNYTATGADLGNQKQLQVSDRLGLSRNLAGGGQFATGVLNSLFWDFGTGSVQGGSAALVTNFTQPLLRGAFRHVRLENLTQAERNLLYGVRDFARFRRTFHLAVSSEYLSLLTQVQAIHNTRSNVANLQRNLREYEQLVTLKMASQIQSDQVFIQYQNARLSLLSSEQSLIASLDQFKFRLGLPPWVPFKIDESLLEPFELVSPEIEALQSQADELYLSLVQYLAPDVAPREVLLKGFEQYKTLRDQADELLPGLAEDLAKWLARLEAVDTGSLGIDDLLDHQQQLALAERIEERLLEQQQVVAQREAFDRDLLKSLEDYDKLPPESDEPKPPAAELSQAQRIAERAEEEEVKPELLATEAMQSAVGRNLREELDEIYVTQSQIRMFLIELEPFEIQEQRAITFAHRNRLDLMNSQAAVMDAFRKVEVAADALQSDLSVTGSVAVGSDPSKNNALRFDSSANTYRVGAQFDGPLNRLNERNFFRAQQIAYQRISRSYVADKDQVSNEVRSILRQLKLRRLNFQIARQQLVAATRQVDQAQIDLRTNSSAGSNLTLFLLQALQGMLDAKNNLISNWIDYRVQKMRLFVALEMLYLDDQGEWINAETGLQELARFTDIDPEYFPPGWVDPSGVPASSAAIEASEDDTIAELNYEPAGELGEGELGEGELGEGSWERGSWERGSRSGRLK